MGEDEFNEHIQDNIISDGIERITTILQVRYEAYGELHENASKLSNLDIIKLKVTPVRDRLSEFMKLASVKESELKTNSITDAFERYYDTGLNSAKPQSIGVMLERLVNGDYLNKENTDLLLSLMKGITTGDHRIKAGLPNGTIFAQKTGTQIGRAANIGIIFPKNDKPPIIVAAFAEKFEVLGEAESALENVGRLISEKWLK
jgi:beta-lactamase class A